MCLGNAAVQQADKLYSGKQARSHGGTQRRSKRKIKHAFGRGKSMQLSPASSVKAPRGAGRQKHVCEGHSGARGTACLRDWNRSRSGNNDLFTEDSANRSRRVEFPHGFGAGTQRTGFTYRPGIKHCVSSRALPWPRAGPLNPRSNTCRAFRRTPCVCPAV